MASTEPSTSRENKTVVGKSVIDNTTRLQTVLDFSFLNLQEVREITGEEPRQGPGKKKIFKDPNGKFEASCLRMNNNFIAEVKDLHATLTTLLYEPSNVTWIDLSFNNIVKIDACICDFRNLKMLYFHGNQLQEIHEVDKLSGLPRLQKLTLHGNPIENKVKGYRYYVISIMPQLSSFDMTSVTKGDRATASNFKLPRTKTKKKELVL